MDSTAFHELIAQVRGAAATLAEAEKKVAAFKAEPAQQENATSLRPESGIRLYDSLNSRERHAGLPGSSRPIPRQRDRRPVTAPNSARFSVETEDIRVFMS
jgi:hypothetical protein